MKVFIVQGWKTYDKHASIPPSHAYYRHKAYEPYPVLIIGICLSWFSVLMKLNDITGSFSM